MSSPERWVVLGLAPVRSSWFAEVARWSTSAVLPIEFVKCLSSEEVAARMVSGRAHSALLVDAAVPALDRDLVDAATSAGCAVLAVSDGRTNRDWQGLGVTAVLPHDFVAGQLLDALGSHATPIARPDRVVLGAEGAPVRSLWRGRMVAVVGGGGVGTSTLAAAIATGFAADPRHRGLVVLADLALDADQALLHHAGDVVPGVQELVEAYRRGTPGPDELRALTVRVAQADYALLLGLRRHRDWPVLRGRALEAAVDGLRRVFTVVVADTDPDLEGESDTGSADIENRNVMARTVIAPADVVVAVGRSSIGGVHRLVTTMLGLLDHGVSPARILPVVNEAPRSPAVRAELTRTVADLVGARSGEVVNPVVAVPHRRRVDAAQRDAARLPASLVTAIAPAVQAVLDRSGAVDLDPAVAPRGPERVEPGSLGAWPDDDDESRAATG